MTGAPAGPEAPQTAEPPRLRPLTRALVRERLLALQALDADTPGEAWAAEHWAADLPGKWELSRAASVCDRLVGFLVASRRGDAVHVHRVAVAADVRGLGVGRTLLHAAAAAALADGRPALTLKVSEGNVGARRLYERLGFAVEGADAGVLRLRAASAAVAHAAARPPRPDPAPTTLP